MIFSLVSVSKLNGCLIRLGDHAFVFSKATRTFRLVCAVLLEGVNTRGSIIKITVRTQNL